MRPAEPVGIGVVAVAEHGHAGVRGHDGGRIDPRDVGYHQVGGGARDGGQLMPAQEALEPSAEEEVDPLEYDRRHGATVAG